MSRARLLLLSLMLVGGCHGGPVAQDSDRILLEMASHPFDVAPPLPPDNKPNQPVRSEERGSEDKKGDNSLLLSPHSSLSDAPAADIQTVAFLQQERSSVRQADSQPKYELTIPQGVPGSEAAPIPDMRAMSPEQKQRAMQRLFPDLPPLPEEPVPQAGPEGRRYTLADFQKLAVENSPRLKQAVADVKSAEGALVQAKTYQNPTVAYQASPTNNNSNAGAQGGYIEQPLRMWGKMKLGVAAAQKDLDNATLALRRARSDLSTNVRNAYFTFIVAQETMRVNRALTRFSDEIYRIFVGYVRAGLAASYEPTPLRAQAYTNRLAYQQAIYGYIAAWNQLVATMGLHHLPLTEVSGGVDRFIPYYDYDKVRAYVLANHTDVLSARNGVQKAQYNLKLAQITPLPDVDVLGAVWKESTIAPYVIFYQAQVVMPIPVWDRNKGNIVSAQATLIRAAEETHRVENDLTATLAANYMNYQNNLAALESYRRNILPDQVSYYRGVFNRRQADPEVAKLPPADLVTAQQALAASVQNYLSILGSLWSAVVSVADLIQTPDLFQLATPRELPELPNLEQAPPWMCSHGRMAAAPALLAAPAACPQVIPHVKPAPAATGGAGPVLPPASDSVLPEPRKSDEAPTLPPSTTQQGPQAKPANLTQQLSEPPPDIPKTLITESSIRKDMGVGVGWVERSETHQKRVVGLAPLDPPYTDGSSFCRAGLSRKAESARQPEPQASASGAGEAATH